MFVRVYGYVLVYLCICFFGRNGLNSSLPSVVSNCDHHIRIMVTNSSRSILQKSRINTLEVYSHMRVDERVSKGVYMAWNIDREEGKEKERESSEVCLGEVCM